MKAFILAAGFGTRLKSETKDKIPKVMVKVGGKPIVAHLVDLCVHHKINDIFIEVGHLAQVIIDFFNNNKIAANIHFIHNKKCKLGSAAGLKKIKKLVSKDDICIMNGDTMMNINLSKMRIFHEQKKGLGTFLVHDTDHPFDSDLVEFNQNFLITKFFRPKPGDNFKAISKSGIHVFTARIFKLIPNKPRYMLESDLIPDLLRRNEKLYAYYSNEYSKDTGTPERLAKVRKDYEAGKITF